MDDEEFDRLVDLTHNVNILLSLECTVGSKIYKHIKVIERLVELNPNDQYRVKQLKDIYSVVEKYKNKRIE